MKTDVADFVAHCDVCQRVNPKLPENAPPLHSIAVPKKVWNQVGIDLVGPLPKTESGNQYICGLTDYFSKWTEAVPIKSKSSIDVAEVVYSTICRLGAMEVLISDQGE